MVADSRLKINLEKSFHLGSLLTSSWLAWQCHFPCLGYVIAHISSLISKVYPVLLVIIIPSISLTILRIPIFELVRCAPCNGNLFRLGWDYSIICRGDPLRNFRRLRLLAEDYDHRCLIFPHGIALALNVLKTHEDSTLRSVE